MYQQCTNRQKQSNSKKWPLVYQSSHVYTESAEYTKPQRWWRGWQLIAAHLLSSVMLASCSPCRPVDERNGTCWGQIAPTRISLQFNAGHWLYANTDVLQFGPCRCLVFPPSSALPDGVRPRAQMTYHSLAALSADISAVWPSIGPARVVPGFFGPYYHCASTR